MSVTKYSFGDEISINTNQIYSMLGSIMENAMPEGKVLRSEVRAFLVEGDERSFSNLIKGGTTVVSAVLALSDNTIECTVVDKEVRDALVIAKKSCQFVLYSVLFTGSVPPSNCQNLGKFMTSNLNVTPSEVKSLREAFSNIESFYNDCSWIKSVNLKSLGQKAKNRLALGIPGMRFVSAIALTPPRRDASPEAIECHSWVMSNLKGVLSWDLHPATRSSDVIAQLGSMNRCLGELVLELYTDAQIDNMVSTKMLYSKPVADIRNGGWRNYSSIEGLRARIERNKIHI